MAYKVFFRVEDKDLSLEDFYEIFKNRSLYRIAGNKVFYENHDTAAGFVCEYLPSSDTDSENVRPDGIYRFSLSVEYCQPAFFFVEALYEMNDIINDNELIIHDPQIDRGSELGVFNQEEMFDRWELFNEDAVYRYISNLGRDIDTLSIMPYNVIKGIWEWNFSINTLREMFDKHMCIPTILAIDYNGKEQTSVIWQDGSAIIIPEVDVVIIARRKGNNISGNSDMEYIALEYGQVENLVSKYSQEKFGNASLLSYQNIPEEIQDFVAQVNSQAEFSILDMCDLFEREVIESALGMEKV